MTDAPNGPGPEVPARDGGALAGDGDAPVGNDVPPAAPSEPGRGKRAHRLLVPTLLVVATLVGFAATFAVWVNRQALNTDNWASTSSRVLADPKVNTALSGYLVNELFTNVDVAGVIRPQLPKQLQAAAAPAAAGLQQLAGQLAPRLLSSPAVQDAWVQANRFAHKELLRIVEGGGSTVSTKSGVVTLNLRTIVNRLAADLGVSSQVAAVRGKLQGSTGATIRGAAQQKLGITLPPSTGQLVILRSNQLKTAQDVASAVKGLALVLPILAIALFALAVWLARGRRRTALRGTGWCLVVIGVLLLLIRRVGGNQVVDALVKVPSNKSAVHQVWNIGTSLLYAIAVAMIVYGLITVIAAWLAGPTRPATFLRRAMAPGLRDSPAVPYAVVGGLLLLVIVWGPTPAFRQIAWIALFIVLLALGVTALRRQTAAEFPDIEHGDALRGARERWSAARARRAAGAAPPAAPVAGTQLDTIERLASLHDRGALTDEEFAVQKTQAMSGG